MGKYKTKKIIEDSDSHALFLSFVEKKIIAEKIFAVRIKLLYRHLLISIPANFLCATIILIGLLGIYPTRVWSWYIGVICISVLRLILSKFHTKFMRPRTQLNVFIVGVTFSAIFWGMAGSLLMPPDLYRQMLVIVIIAGVTAGGLQTLQASLLASIVFVVCSILPLCIWLITRNKFTYIALGAAMTTYLLFLIGTSWRAYRLILEILQLRFENVSLIKNMAEVNDSLEEANQSLQESQKRFRSAFDYSMIGMALVLPDGKWLKVNNSLCGILGYTEKELSLMDIQTIIFAEDLTKNLGNLRQMLAGKIANYQMENRFIRKNGELIWVSVSSSLIRNQANKPLYFITEVEDIDARKKAAEQLKEYAFHDQLTGLANRKQLENEFDRVIKYAERNHKKIAVYFVDLDQFKQVNDHLGHEAGDTLLKIIALRLQACVRQTDIVSRIGGDEFIVIATEIVHKKDMIEIAQKIQKNIAEPMTIKNDLVHITSSIGISIYPDNGLDLPVLIKNADKALYKAKKEGRNNYKFYSSADLT